MDKWEGIHDSKINIKNKPKDYENNTNLLKRAKKVLDLLLSKYNKETILIVGHEGINKAIISTILGMSSYSEKIMQDNTCVNIVEINQNKSRIHLINCTKHLE